MAEDANARIRVDIDTAAALANIKNLQRQISTFHTSLAKSGAQATASSLQLQQSLINGINRTGQFSAGIKNIKTTTDSFTNSLQKNKLSMGEYFRYSGAATKTFGRFFKSEFETINKVARERVKDLQTQYIKMGRDANGAMRAIAVRPLALDMENLATKTQIAAQRQALLNQLLKQGSTNLLNFGKNTQWAGRQLMVGFTVPLIMLGSVAAKTFMDMEKQAVRFKRVYGEMFTTTEETNKALQDIKNLANEFTKYGVAVSKTMELAADIAATGKMGAELTAQVAETTRLAVLGGVEQSKALEATISLTDAFGVSAEDLAGKIDFLNAVENQTITSIEDLTIAIPKAGPVVQQLGGDVEDLTFFLTAMREGGINASEGANALKSGLASLINPTRQASEMLSGFGINIKGIVDANEGDVKGLILDFASALDDLSPLNRAQAIEQLFGKFQFARMSTLFQNVIKEGNQASRVLKLTNATTAELAVLSERELKKVEDSPMFKFQKALEDIKVTLVPLGEAFLKAVTPLLEFGTSVLKKFDELDEGAKGFVVGLTAIAGVIGPVFLMGFGLIANGVANVVKGFVFFKTAMNKAGSASTQLGMQTEYMTQQQLEAAAVAASLDQVHSKLRQTFTSETAAINGLTAAYDRAIARQMAFAGTPMAVGRGAKAAPKKYASGVISVPGPKGAGDIVPAMLSPGEAIIPAEKAEKYRGFIEALIAGNIPGFFSGTGNVAAPTPPKPERASNYIQGPFDKPIEQSKAPAQPRGKADVDYVRAIAKREIAGSGFSSSPDEVRRQTESKSWAGMDREMAAKKAEIERMRQEGRKISSSQERSLLKSTPDAAHVKQSSYKVDVAGRQIPTKSWMARSLMADDPMVNRYAAQANLEKGGGGTKSTQNALKSMMNPKGQDALAKQLGVSQRELNKQLKLLSQGISPSSAGGSKVMQELARRDPKPNQGRLAAAALRARDDFAKKNPGKGFYETTGSRKYDPSKDEAVRKKQEAATAKADARAKAKVEKLTKAQQAESARAFAKSQEAEKAKTAALAKETKASEKATKEKVAATKVVKENKKETVKSTKTIKEAAKAPAKLSAPVGPAQAQRVTARETKQGTRYYSGNKLVADQKAGQMRYNRQQGAIKAAETRKANAAVKAQAPQGAQDKAQGGRGAMGGRGGMLGMVASGAVMAGSMLPGSAGKVAQDLMLPVMALSMILPMLPAGIGIAVAAVAALAIGAFALKGAFDKAQKEALEMTESLGSGKKAILAYSEFAGTASAGEIMDKQRKQNASPFNVQQGKTTFGESFVTGEQGKSMLDSLRKGIAENGSSATQAQLVNQLGTAIASGALSESQARSIAASIGQELGNQSFGINVNAKIIEIFGPNGENLINEPLEVRVKMIQETQDQLGAVAQASQPQMTTGGIQAGAGTALAAGGVAATALGVAAALSAAGLIAQTVPIIGTVSGGIALATAGAIALTVGIWQGVEGMAKMGQASATNVAMGMVAMQQQKEMLDSLDLEYQRRIANAVAAGDVAKAEELTTQHMLDREALLAKNAETTQMVLDNFTNQGSFLGMNFNQGAYKEAASKALTAAYEDDPVMGQIAKGAYDKTIAAGGLDDTQEYQMTLLLANKELDPGMVMQLLDSFGNDKDQMTKILNIMTNIGSADGNRAIGLMNAFVDEEGNALPDQQKTFIANIESKSPADAQKSLAMFEEVAKLGGANVLETSVIMQFYNKNPEAAAEMEDMVQKINSYNGELTMDFVQNLVGEGQFEAFKQNQAYFESLDDQQRKDYVSAFVNTMALEGDPDMIEAWKAWQSTLPADQKSRAFEDFATVTAVRVTEAGTDRTSAPVEEEDTGGGGGGGPDSSPLDDLLKKLRDVRKNQIGVTKGFEASANAINKLFGGGAGINLFSGIENDMRRLGAGEDLVSLIAGMDPEEFEKRKNTLFNFDKQTGEIIGFKDQLLNIGKALSAIALGEYVSQQQKNAKESRNQVLAFNQLRAAGYSVAEAYEMIQDASVAAAIATGDVTGEQMDTMLQEMRAAQDAMKEAARLTPEGLQEVFEDGFNKAMEAFDVKEKKLTLEYELQIADDQALIDEAQNQIAAIQYQLDDYEADLRGIEDQEKAINKTYDEKVKALEEVRKANQKVLDQEKGKLSVAEAISRGDLAATARAAQDLRATSASGYFSSQTDALNAGRQSALDQVRGEDGLSRIEIEEKIKDLTDQIFEIEEKTLEPAQERIRLAGIELQARIDELTELGKTKAEWETIKNNIDLARVNSAGYKSAMEEALAVVEDVKDAWGGIQDKTVTLTTIQRTVTEGQASPGSPGGPGGPGGPSADPLDPANDTPAAQSKRVTDAAKTSHQVATALNRAANALPPVSETLRRERVARYLSTITKAQADSILAVMNGGGGGGGAGIGYIRVASGGSVSGPGTGTSDSIPAMLSNGEYVVKAAAAKKLGRRFLDSVNAGKPRPLPGMRPNNMVFAGGTPNFNEVTGKPAFKLPSMSIPTPPMPQIPSGPSFKLPPDPGISKGPISLPDKQPQANNNSSVYNYNLSVNVASQSDPSTIAQTVMAQLQRVESQRVRNGRF
jgi:TP901 family phage tail tape measure protein